MSFGFTRLQCPYSTARVSNIFGRIPIGESAAKISMHLLDMYNKLRSQCGTKELSVYEMNALHSAQKVSQLLLYCSISSTVATLKGVYFNSQNCLSSLSGLQMLFPTGFSWFFLFL
uniref:Uncharacterized protein n=1 Tax=Micrurus lemniscatus lemniscatus TaxID=129467 RepID=A0A2D4JNP4_MICLE